MRGLSTSLIVLGIVVMVGGLALCGIGQLRDAAGRMSCQNNLKQIALALHNYHDTSGRFPLATEPHATLPPEKRLSWMPAIMPYMECLPRLLLDPNEAWDVEPNREPMFRWSGRDKGDTVAEGEARLERLGPYRTFLCPVNFLHERPGLPPMTHYVGVGGVGPDAAALPEDDPRAGFFGYHRKTRMSDVIDGIANTLVVVETSTDNGPWTAGGYPTVRSPDPDSPPHFGPGAPFSSRHLGNPVNVAFGDGSVRTLAPSISPEVFESLCVIRGGRFPAGW